MVHIQVRDLAKVIVPCPMAIMLGSGFISSGLCGLPKLGGDDAVSIMLGSISLTSHSPLSLRVGPEVVRPLELGPFQIAVQLICRPTTNKHQYSRRGICSDSLIGLSLILAVPPSAWADGKLAELAEQLGKKSGTSITPNLI